MFEKPRRGLRRKISNALKSGKFFIALGWIDNEGKGNWHVETNEYPNSDLVTVRDGMNVFVRKELMADEELGKKRSGRDTIGSDPGNVKAEVAEAGQPSRSDVPVVQRDPIPPDDVV